ncbi:MAG TPA: hypothetical protein VJ625_09605 [Propionibacteriaceae bacterium]|nr:hypothetical protein [Propionibacteriaceae bacterium]
MTTTLTLPSPREARLPPAPQPGITLWLLRIALTVHALAAVAQPVIAGRYLSGDFDALTVHAANAGLVMLTTIGAFGAAVLYWAAGRGAGWPALTLAVMFVAVIAQTALGALRVLAIHIPLGVAIVAFALGLAVWSFRPGARRTRSSRVPITRQEVRR